MSASERHEMTSVGASGRVKVLYDGCSTVLTVKGGVVVKRQGEAEGLEAHAVSEAARARATAGDCGATGGPAHRRGPAGGWGDEREGEPMYWFLARLAERWADERPTETDEALVASARRVVTMAGQRWDREAERTFRRELARWAV